MGALADLVAEGKVRHIGLSEAWVEAIAAEAGATPAQIALAWLLAQGNDIAPIPGTRRVHRVEENIAADAVELTKEQIQKLNDMPAAAGGHHTEAQMRMIER